MPADQSFTSRSLFATHCLDVRDLADSAPVRVPTAAPRRWVEAAQTELGLLADALVGGVSYLESVQPTPDPTLDERPGFARPGQREAIATAQTAFMLAIDDDEKETDEDEPPVRGPTAMGMIVAVPAVRPQSPIAGQTDTTGPMTPVRHPLRDLDPSAVRALLSQPTAALLPMQPARASVASGELPSERVQALSLPALATPAPVKALKPLKAAPPLPPAATGPLLATAATSSTPLPVLARAPKARPQTFLPVRPSAAKARARSFAEQLALGVPVRPLAIPADPTAPMSTAPFGTAPRVVVTRRSPQRALNMTAAILSGLAAAMAVMAVVVSV